MATCVVHVWPDVLCGLVHWVLLRLGAFDEERVWVKALLSLSLSVCVCVLVCWGICIIIRLLTTRLS